jgi:hypothetical protein
MRQLFFILFILFSLSSCKKNNDNPAGKSRTQLLVDKKWKIVAINVKLAGTTTLVDDFSRLPDYSKDDYFLFKSNLTYEYNDNSLRNPDWPTQIINDGTWQLQNSDEYLILDSYDSTWVYSPTRITKITETELKTETEDQGNISYTTYNVIQ